MSRVISDELFEKLIAPISEGRLLGVMGLLERLKQEAIEVYAGGSIQQKHFMTGELGKTRRTWEEELNGETKTNSN